MKTSFTHKHMLATFVGIGMFVHFTFAQGTGTGSLIDDQIGENLPDISKVTTNLETKELKFVEGQTCETLESTLQAAMKKYGNMGRYGRGMLEEGMGGGMAIDTAASVSNDSKSTPAPVASSTNDFSSTNIQKAGVEESDIIKTDGKIIYYYNAQESQIQVLQSPLDTTNSMIDMSKAQLLKVLRIPQTMSSIQLYVQNKKLVIIGNRYLETVNIRGGRLDQSSRTTTIIFDMNNPRTPQLLKIQDTAGRYQESRMIGSKLYLLSQRNVNRYWPVAYAEGDKQETPIIDVDKDLSSTISVTQVNPKGATLTEKYKINKPMINCSNISTLFPDDDTLEHMGQYPVFTIISTIDTDNLSQEIPQKVILAQSNQIHMSLDALYITSQIWTPSPMRCTDGTMCIMPVFYGGNQTLIHKFDLKNNLKYVASRLLPGNTLNQYSIDEDDKGNLRILTTTRENTQSTHLFILDAGLKLLGKLNNIEPGEDFKAARFIGKYLYLVTFEQIDPLFVIDMTDSTKPTLKGKLKLPGYSTYLHPLNMTNSNQVGLLGLGYDVTDNQRGGQSNGGIQLATYKIDFNSKATVEDTCGPVKHLTGTYEECVRTFDPSMINVKLVDSKVLGGQGSQSEVLYNPRAFVMDKNNTVTLPLALQEKGKDGQYCTIQYDGNGKEIGKICYPQETYTTSFAGIKSFGIGSDLKITEKYSKDYKNLITSQYPMYDKVGTSTSSDQPINVREFVSMGSRAGYAGDALYFVTNQFAHFFIPGTSTEKIISLKNVK